MEVTRYHADMPNWRNTAADKAGILLGIELEVHHRHGKDNAADVLDNFDNGEHPMPLAEDDSSLDRILGVEIICPPLPLEEVTGKNGYISRLMADLTTAGTTVNPTARYGLHVNINLADWSGQEKLVVQYLLNRFATTGSAIGKRTTGFGSYMPTFVLAPRGTDVEFRTYPGDKHCAAYLRRPGTTTREAAGGENSKVMEVRLAKSTLEIENLRLVVDYVFALRRWVALAPRHTLACCFLDRIITNSATQIDLMETMFKHWCSKYAPTVFAAVETVRPAQSAKNRLALMQEYVSGEAANRISLTRVGLHNDKVTTVTEQAVRVSSLIGKGVSLKCQFTPEGLVGISSVRAAD